MGKDKDLGSAFVGIEFRPEWKGLSRAVKSIEKRFHKMGADAGRKMAEGMESALQRMKGAPQITNKVTEANERMVQSLRKTSPAAQSAGGGLGKLKSMLGALAASYVAVRVIGKLTAAFQGLKSVGMRTNAEMEVSAVAFEKMIGSAREAKVMLGQLRDFSAATPLQFPGIMKAATGLLATKKVAKKELIPTLQKLADTAAGSTEGFAAFPRIARAINQMMSKGRIQAEEMMQLAEAGVPAWKSLASAMGKSIGEVRQMGERGKLGADAISKLIEGLGADYEGLADKQSKTFQGLTSTIKDKVALLAAQAFKPWFELTKKLAEKKLDFLNSEAAQQFATTFAKISQMIIDVFAKLTSNPWAKWIAGATAGGVALTVAVALAAKLGVVLAGLAGAISPLAVAVGGVVAVAVIGAKFVKDSWKKALSMGAKGEQMKADLKAMWFLAGEIGQNLMAVGKRAVEFVKIFFQSFKRGNNQTSSFWHGFISGLRQVIDFVSLLTTDFAKGWELIKAAASLGLTDMQIQVLKFTKSFVDAFADAARNVVKIWGRMASAMAQSILKQAAAGGILGKIWNTILGVDVKGEVERGRALNAAIAKRGGAANADPMDQMLGDAARQIRTMESDFDAYLVRKQESFGDALDAMTVALAESRKEIEKEGVKVWLDLMKAREDKRANRGDARAKRMGQEIIGGAIKAGLEGVADLFKESDNKKKEEEKKKTEKFGTTSVEGLHSAIQNALNKDKTSEQIKDEALKQTVLQEKMNNALQRVGEAFAKQPRAAAEGLGGLLGRALVGVGPRMSKDELLGGGAQDPFAPINNKGAGNRFSPQIAQGLQGIGAGFGAALKGVGQLGAKIGIGKALDPELGAATRRLEKNTPTPSEGAGGGFFGIGTKMVEGINTLVSQGEQLPDELDSKMGYTE